jgi:hypothetical protein
MDMVLTEDAAVNNYARGGLGYFSPVILPSRLSGGY